MTNSENINSSEDQDTSYFSQEFPYKNDDCINNAFSESPQENSQGNSQDKPVIIQRTNQQGFRIGVEKSTGKKVLILQVEEGIQNQNISDDVFFHFRDARPEDFGFYS